MTKKTRVAMIGCGFFAQNHLHAWRDLADEGAELVAVCDVDKSKAEAASKRFGAPAYSDVAAMTREVGPDLVDIATRMDTHRALCAHFADHGIAVIVQKPLAPSWADCVAIADKARESGQFLAVHENFRFQRPMLDVAALLAAGAIGTPSWARLSFRTGYDVYSNQPYFYDEERLAILDVGIHLLDLARVFLGDVETICCETQRRNPKVKAEDTAAMLLRHRSGAVSIVECTYEARRHPDPFPHTRVEIEGDRGSLLLASDDEILLSDDRTSRSVAVTNLLRPWMERPWHVVQASVYETNKSTLRAFQTGARAATHIGDNLKTYAVVEAAYRAASTRSVQRLDMVTGPVSM